ncbi:hypothetical protein EXIGLDRAFT_725878 [Exidia glandulosa HHB12029]|uniref:Stress-associated endoplasmic reticulum protein n=1 Tax=Exidia glandulosa HHB12029 TaxID=1314781 RepID=A0A165MGX3_EXIGL|nr:hypothetical protein EXIGLDRAFT_725878 [Exidia glandulosa HHB12029]
MPTEFEMRRKNEAFAARARDGKPTQNKTRAERAQKRSPVGLGLLAILGFVVVGGTLFELVRIIFLR